MELDWLEDFLALSASGSFSRAAEQRHVTQPAFSRRIRALEDWTGVPLIDRSAHPASLTEAGRRFRPAAEEILRRLASAREEARAAEEAAAATLRFAATHALSFSFFPAWLRGLEPGLRTGPVQLVSDSLQACEELMLQGRAQFLLCHHHPAASGRLAAPEFLSARVGADTLVPVAAPDGTGGPSFAVPGGSPGEVLPVLAYNEASGLGRILRAVRGGAMAGIRVEVVFTSHLAVVLKRMALDGRGVAWLPQSLVGDELRDGRLVRAADDGWLVPVEIRLVRRRAAAAAAARRSGGRLGRTRPPRFDLSAIARVEGTGGAPRPKRGGGPTRSGLPQRPATPPATAADAGRDWPGSQRRRCDRLSAAKRAPRSARRRPIVS